MAAEGRKKAVQCLLKNIIVALVQCLGSSGHRRQDTAKTYSWQSLRSRVKRKHSALLQKQTKRHLFSNDSAMNSWKEIQIYIHANDKSSRSNLASTAAEIRLLKTSRASCTHCLHQLCKLCILTNDWNRLPSKTKPSPYSNVFTAAPCWP